MLNSITDMENDASVVRSIDMVLDSYNSKKITKEVMLERCKKLHTKLSLAFTQSREQKERKV